MELPCLYRWIHFEGPIARQVGLTSLSGKHRIPELSHVNPSLKSSCVVSPKFQGSRPVSRSTMCVCRGSGGGSFCSVHPLCLLRKPVLGTVQLSTHTPEIHCRDTVMNCPYPPSFCLERGPGDYLASTVRRHDQPWVPADVWLSDARSQALPH